MEPYSSDNVKRKKINIDTFKSIPDPIKDNSKSDNSFSIVCEEERKILVFIGKNCDAHSKAIKIKIAREICRQFSPEYTLISVNEGEETPEFIRLLYSGFKKKEKSNTNRRRFKGWKSLIKKV